MNIERNGTPEYAVIPIDEFKQLTADAEMLSDISAYKRAKCELGRVEDEMIPANVEECLLKVSNITTQTKYHAIPD